MSDLDPALIEAVAKAIYESRPHKWLLSGEVVPWGIVGEIHQAHARADAVAAIRAIDAHRAAQVREAVTELMDAAYDYYLSKVGSKKEETLYQEARTLKAALLALVNAQEEPSDV